MTTSEIRVERLAGFDTWFRTVRPKSAPPRNPLVLLHGGPGLDHRTLVSLEDLAEQGHMAVFYDQRSCGRSDGPADYDEVCVEDFVEQLEALRECLAAPHIDLLGHSWGGMLALMYALRYPDQIGRLILHSAIASWPHCEQARRAFPWPVDPGDEAARRRFDEAHCCRQTPWPKELELSVREMNVDLARVMWAPGDADPRGLLVDWDVQARLPDVSAPTLVLAGRHDGYAPGQAELFRAGIPGSRSVRFEHSAHYAHLEEPEAFRAVVHGFLSGIPVGA